MKEYSRRKEYSLYQGSMLDMQQVIENNSIDAIVTDPPYELGFMGKSWDNSGIAFQKETWAKCLDVLKPGGYLLAFGGSRTFHRIACAIEDAGFEIRDTIMWVYGCYSSDTQVLTDKGWKYFYELDRTEKVLQWDKKTEKLSWIKPLEYFEYDIDDDMRIFENQHISQLVTQNHKVAVSVKKRRKEFEPYELIEAKDIKDSWILNFPLAGYMDGSIKEKNAYMIGWWLTDAWAHGDRKAVMFSQSKHKTLNKLRSYFDENSIKYSEYTKKAKSENHNIEHTFYVTGPIADFLLKKYPDRKLTWEMLNWDKESKLALIEGLMDGDGSERPGEYSKTFWSRNTERLDIFQALCISVGYRAYISYDNYCVVFNVKKSSTQTQKRHHKQDVHYKGKVYCIRTETGAFVVRRSGKAFISGNSGFPKSMNIGLAVDKKLGVESKSVGMKKQSGAKFKLTQELIDNGGFNDKNRTEYEVCEAQNEWKGWGTALKPAYEPVIVARKPCEGSAVENVMKYGVGGINIDECRVGTERIVQHQKDMSVYNNNNLAAGKSAKSTGVTTETNGRFPANMILTYGEKDFEEVCGGFPTGGKNGSIAKTYVKNNNVFGEYGPCSEFTAYQDSGSAARYYYCAKATKKDREEGLEKLETKYRGMSNQAKAEIERGNNGFDGNENTIGLNRVVARKNDHPCVKPTELMQYLVRLVTPAGGLVLDPFNGSGSTGKAVMYENKERNKGYRYVGIELNEEYLDISKARIEYVTSDEPVIEDPDVEGQISIFDYLNGDE